MKTALESRPLWSRVAAAIVPASIAVAVQQPDKAVMDVGSAIPSMSIDDRAGRQIDFVKSALAVSVASTVVKGGRRIRCPVGGHEKLFDVNAVAIDCVASGGSGAPVPMPGRGHRPEGESTGYHRRGRRSDSRPGRHSLPRRCRSVIVEAEPARFSMRYRCRRGFAGERKRDPAGRVGVVRRVAAGAAFNVSAAPPPVSACRPAPPERVGPG